MAKAPMRGFPQHGDEYVDEEEGETDEEARQKAGEGGGDGKKVVEPAPKETIEERIARLEGENSVLKAQVNARPTPEAKKKEPEPEPDWEKLMYDDPGEYTRQLRASVKREVTAELGGQYQKDQGEKDFWVEFYADNDDLKADKDMVNMVLRSNISTLGDLPVSEAQKKLADLTRERIMRYTGKQQKKDDEGKKNKARVEGAGSRQAPSKSTDNDDDKVVTLSDIIRARKAKRAKALTA